MQINMVVAVLCVEADWEAESRLREPPSFKSSYTNAPTKILIVGGGFGGLAAARVLARTLGGSEEAGVALLDRVNYTTFWPMVPSAISGNIEIRHAARSIRRITKPLGAEFFQAKVVEVDFEVQKVRSDIGSFPY